MRTRTTGTGRRTGCELLAAISAVGLLVAACAASGSNGGPATTVPTLPISDPSAQPTAFGCQGGVLAVDIGRAQVPLAQASYACASGPPIASGSPWPISAKQAANIFRAFVGLPKVPFEVTGPYQDASRKLYSLSSQGYMGIPRYSFLQGTVDATTGDVSSLSYSARVVDGPGPQLIDAATAQSKAADYLRAHSIDVAGLTVSSAPTDFGWELTWERMDGDVGLPPRATVMVDWQYGDVVTFSRVTEVVDAASISQPKISQAQAEALAVSSMWATEPKVEASRLRYVDRGYSGIRLIWEVYVSGKDSGARKYLEYLFDAVTGELM